MALGQFVQQTEILVPEVDGVLIKVDPAYSSTSAKIIAGAWAWIFILHRHM